jgi:hypothetical protein
VAADRLGAGGEEADSETRVRFRRGLGRCCEGIEPLVENMGCVWG